MLHGMPSRAVCMHACPCVRDGFVPLQVFQLPTALAYPLFYKLAQPGASTVSLQAVQSWIVQQKVMQVGCSCRILNTHKGAPSMQHVKAEQHNHGHPAWSISEGIAQGFIGGTCQTRGWYALKICEVLCIPLGSVKALPSAWSCKAC